MIAAICAWASGLLLTLCLIRNMLYPRSGKGMLELLAAIGCAVAAGIFNAVGL